MTVQIITGSCMDVLPTLEAGSVQLCLTSPPYFNLRDYGTATWEGGDAACDHRLDTQHQKQGATSARAGRSNIEAQRNENFRNTCGKCGAVRTDHQIGSEPTPDAFVATMVAVFREVRRVLRDDGIVVCNLGDSYSGSGKGPTGHNGIENAETRQGFESGYLRANGEWSKGGRKSKTEGIGGIPSKNLLMIPFRVAMALQADGWYLRSVIPWIKRNPMPESVQDRPASAIEYLFLLGKSRSYYWDGDSIRVDSVTETERRRGPKIYTDGAYHRNGLGASTLGGGNQAGRSYRNSDAFMQSWQGLMCDEDGDPMALVVNPMPNTEKVTSTERVPVAWDDADDDTERIASLDCPAHADRPVATSRHGEPLGDLLDDTRHSGTGLVPRRQVVPAPTPLLSSEALVLGSSGDPSAIAHSTPSSKTVLHAETISACTASAQTSFRTDGTSVPRETSGLHPDTPESSTSVDSASDATPTDPRERTPARTPDTGMIASVAQQQASFDGRENASHTVSNRSESLGEDLSSDTETGTTRTSSCTCSYFKTIIRETSHYASFPPGLVAPFVKAGTSERGACDDCGSPWVRVVEKLERSEFRRESPGKNLRQDNRAAGLGVRPGMVNGHYDPHGDSLARYASSTTGWAPSCQCGTTETRPCVVLDPFGGSGTVGMVADRLGRDAILIELNESYVRMARDRIDNDAGSLFADPVQVTAVQTEMFAADADPVAGGAGTGGSGK